MAVEGSPPLDATMEDGTDFRAASLSSVRWTSLARVVAEVATVGSGVVLARLISPAEFGRAAIALGFATVALSIAWVGFGSALVQMRSVQSADVEVATLLSLTIGAGLTAITALVLAPYAIEPIFGGRVAYLLKLVSPVFLFSGLGSVPNALMQRRLAFRRLSQIDIVSTLVGPAAAIGLAAAAGLNGEALVLASVVSAFVAMLLTLVSSPPARPRWRKRQAKRVADFGVTAALAAVTGTLFLNIDYAILGARLAAHDVGIYWRSYQLGVEYQGKISGILLRLAFPLYSRAPSVEAMRNLRGKIVRVHTIVLYPCLTTLIVLAPQLVPFLFGSQWDEAVFPTQILAIAGLATVAAVGTASLAFAAGKPRAVLYFFLVLLTGYALVVTLASGYGLRTVVIAVAIYQVVLLAAQFYFLETRVVGIPLRETWSAILPALVSSGISLASAYPVARLLENAGASDLIVILAAGTLAFAVYAAAVRILFPASWQEFFRLARALIGRSAPATPAVE